MTILSFHHPDSSCLKVSIDLEKTLTIGSYAGGLLHFGSANASCTRVESAQVADRASFFFLLLYTSQLSPLLEGPRQPTCAHNAVSNSLLVMQAQTHSLDSRAQALSLHGNNGILCVACCSRSRVEQGQHACCAVHNFSVDLHRTEHLAQATTVWSLVQYDVFT